MKRLLFQTTKGILAKPEWIDSLNNKKGNIFNYCKEVLKTIFKTNCLKTDGQEKIYIFLHTARYYTCFF